MINRIVKTTCPSDSVVYTSLNKIDFQDAYAFSVPTTSIPMEEVYTKVFNTSPKWIEYALRLRNWLVSPFGLKTDFDKNKPPIVRVGEKSGIFNIYSISENEVIAGENDKHLDFRVSVHRDQQTHSIITVSTLVQYNNGFGKIYMSIVAPFHKLVVKSILKSAMSRFQEDQ